MELSTVVGIVLFLVLALLLMKFLGKVVSFVFSVIGIIAVVWLVVLGLRWLDANNVRDNFMESNNLFILEDGGSLITGFSTKEGLPEPEIGGLAEEELNNPNSALYDDYYKVIVVQKDALPDKIAIMVDVADEGDKESLFKHYVENSLLEGDFVENLVEEEKTGNIEVYKETLAFRHGLTDVVTS